MPATTGISAIPAERLGFEFQAGFVPSHMLSDATQPPGGIRDPSPQVAVLLEPGSVAPGLVLGLRWFGDADDHGVEPMLGYRRHLGDHIAVAGVGYASTLEAADSGARYRANRYGGELAIDAGTGPGWFSLHAQAALAATYVSAHGSYCVSTAGVGVDCNGGPDVEGNLHGLYPTATGSLTLDIGRRAIGVFHGARLAVLSSVGLMPQIRGTDQRSAAQFHSVGLTLTIGFGGDQPLPRRMLPPE